jgi:isocitrate/isopropylmalate dehydrogenase
MNSLNIALLPGDGIGREVVPAGRRFHDASVRVRVDSGVGAQSTINCRHPETADATWPEKIFP